MRAAPVLAANVVEAAAAEVVAEVVAEVALHVGERQKVANAAHLALAVLVAPDGQS